MPQNAIPAVAYFRTSSAANVGQDKDSERRQRAAVREFAGKNGFEIIDEYYDGAVRGADPIDTRPGFASMLKRIEGNGVRTIIVETASRFARDLMVQEVGYALLRKRGIEIIAADSPTAFQDDTPTAKLIRQVLGAISEFDKAMTVAKLRGARDRLRTRTRTKVEGRKSHSEQRPEVVAEAKRLRRKSAKTGKRQPFRRIAEELAKQGRVGATGRPFAPSVIKTMVES